MDADKERALLEGAVKAIIVNEKHFRESESVGAIPAVVAANAKLRHVVTDVMLRDARQCSLAEVKIEREEEWVFFEWRMKAKNPEQISVTAEARAIALKPDPDRISLIILRDGNRGDGKINLKFAQGDCYQIHFQFTDMLRWDTGDHDAIAGITFNIGIPLSPLKKGLLDRITTTERQIAEAQAEIDMKLGLQAAIDAKLSEGIAQIKARQLSPEAEERQILDLQDTVAHVRDKHGI